METVERRNFFVGELEIKDPCILGDSVDVCVEIKGV